MSREITDRDRVVEAVQNLALTAELFEEQNGKPRYAGDLEVIVYGRSYGNGKQVGPYVRLLEFDPGEEVMRQGEWGGNTFYINVAGELDVSVLDGGSQRIIGQLEPGTCFGEMAVLAGIERNATVTVPKDDSATLLEVTRPALRLLRKLPKFGQVIDETYRAHGFSRVLEDLRLIPNRNLSQKVIDKLRQSARYMVYGKHHVLCREGEPIDRLYLIKSGWIRRTKGVPFHATSPEVVMGMGTNVGVDFVGEGNCLGVEGVRQPATWQFNASLMARSEVLEVPIATIDPEIREELLATLKGLQNRTAPSPPTIQSVKDIRALKSIEQEIATGVIDGANLLVMDMDLCIRCGNCSLACHKMHGQSRLVRRGIQIQRPTALTKPRLQHALIPQVCMHCKDPECLTGCPTGSIFRAPSGHIDIDPGTCIGCFDCATQCPYYAITMVPKEQPKQVVTLSNRLQRLFSLGTPVIKEEPSGSDDVVAIKCNLCEDTPINPKGSKRQAYSCEENCPTGALVRIDPIEYFTEAQETQRFFFKDQTHAIGRNIHQSDPLAGAWNFAGLVLVAISIAATIWGLTKYGFDGSLNGSWLTMRWLTGIVGLAGTAAVMTYPLRKQIYRRRVGALRYWMLAHVYLGVVTGGVLLFHSGVSTGGLLTTLLYIAFDAVIVSGLVGVASYFVLPRILTRIEGEPLLVEDLKERRTELARECDEILQKSEGWAKDEIRNRLIPRYMTWRYLWRQFSRREDLKAQLAEAREDFKEETTRVATEDERELLLDALETIVTMRRVDALLLLHRALRVWIPAHVFSTGLMLALMVVHIVQVVFFKAR